MVEPIRLKPKRPCPICAKPSTQKFHPFCSSHCRQVDLNRWMSGNYAIPAVEAEQPDDGDLDNEP